MAPETASTSAASSVADATADRSGGGPQWLTRRVFGRIMLICGWLDLLLLLILVHVMFFY